MNIYDFAMKYLDNPKVRGKEINSECPFCKEEGKHKFYLNYETGKFMCFRGSCGESGGIQKLKAHFGITEDIQGEAKKHQEPKKTTGKNIAWKQSDFKLVKAGDSFASYLDKRGISLETAKDMRVLKKGNALAFFLTEGDNNIVGIKYRTEDKKIWAEPNSKAVLWNMDLVKDKQLIVTEGEIDAMTVYEAGYKNVVSVPFGVANMDWISNNWAYLESKEEILLCMDNDVAGQKAAKKIINKLDISKVKLLSLGKYKDINEVMTSEGIMAVKDIVDKPIEVELEGIVDISTIARFDINKIDRFLTGIKGLDMALRGLKETELTVIAGDNGSGKSTLIAQIMLSAINQGKKAFVFNGELGAEMFKEWLFLQANGEEGLEVKTDHLTGMTDRIVNDENYEKINRWITKKLHMFSSKDFSDSKILLERMKQSYKKDNTFLFVIDNLTTIQFPNDGTPRHQQLGDFIADLKQFAKDYNCHVIAVNHIIKSADKRGKHLIKGSGVVTDLADNVIMPAIIDDDEVEHDGELAITKNRMYGIMPTICTVFNSTTKRIMDYRNLDAEDVKKYGWEEETYIPF
jgi:twinkle protein